MEANLCFKQLQLNYINSQNKQTKKEHPTSLTSSIRVGLIAKTGDEVYVLSTI